MPFNFVPSVSVHAYVLGKECVCAVPEQPRQLRLRLMPETLEQASEIQRVLQERGDEHSLEAVTALAIRDLHARLVRQD